MVCHLFIKTAIFITPELPSSILFTWTIRHPNPKEFPRPSKDLYPMCPSPPLGGYSTSLDVHPTCYRQYALVQNQHELAVSIMRSNWIQIKLRLVSLDETEAKSMPPKQHPIESQGL